MTIPSRGLISRITTELINSPCAMKQYDFKKIIYIDGCDVTVTIYLELQNNLKCSYFVINTTILSFAYRFKKDFTGNMYSSKRFYFNEEQAVVNICMNELYRVLPDLRIDKLLGCMFDYIDEELENNYVHAENCSVCLEPTHTTLQCKHLLCVPCQYKMHRINSHFHCPLCRAPSVKYFNENENENENDYDTDNSNEE